MSSVTATDASTVNTQSLSSALGGSDALDKDAFLKLLVAQLNHQDPLSPMENEQFIAQLAEFSSLEQMKNINSNLEQSLEADILVSQSMNNSIVTTLIGKDVVAVSNKLSVPAAEETQFGFATSETMIDAKVKIMNESGELIKTVDLGKYSAGQHFIDVSELDLNDGEYTFEVEGLSAATNEPLYADPLVRGMIDGVSYVEGAASLMMGNSELSLGDVIQILQPKN